MKETRLSTRQILLFGGNPIEIFSNLELPSLSPKSRFKFLGCKPILRVFTVLGQFFMK